MRKATVAVLVVMLLGAGHAIAQRLTGGLAVQVLDPEGKAVSEVKASVLSKERGNKVDIVSNSEGQVIMPDLAPGEYEISLQHEGFRTIRANFTARIGVTT